MNARMADVGRVLGLASLYVVSARLGLSLGAVAGFATLVWPPTGFAIAALLLLGIRAWPGVFVGAVVANMLTGASLPVALGIGVGNTAEALVCAHVVTRISRHVRLETVRSVTGLVLGAVAGGMVSASIGVASLYSGGVIGASEWRHAWRAWWVGDVLGALVVAPLILVWSKSGRSPSTAGHIEAAALGLAVVVAGMATFFTDLSILSRLSTPFHQADLLLAVLVWAALRFGQRGAATAAFWISVTAVWATVLGHGPFTENALTQNLLSLQTFMAVLAVTFLVLGATIDERWCALEETRQASRYAERANRAKSEFLAVISHELRTPLNAIAGYSQLLQDNVYGRLNKKQADVIERIHLNEKRLLLLVDEVLGFVSAEKGEVDVHREAIQVSDAFDAVQPLMASQLEEHRCVVERKVRDGLSVRADAKSLQQILMRLVSNASKFGKDGGTVTLGADREGDSVRIWVHDDGDGISQEKMDQVFEPFFQAERPTTRRVSGIGLGLTIARDLARRMEGEVTLTSEPGHGTTASVLLPAA
ncbi:MAG TPA: MASE1 domain-containing protein [Gemmatimonadaceae bacterium]|jgi:signal transduction histidine kinase|nr:MASE1 domain-containing protein [Gemmatimonadaceae bacterium]